MIVERAVHIQVGADRMLGILHGASLQATDLGVVVVVGGPQDRVGSHRQFTLLARDLAAAVNRLMEDGPLRARMGQAGRERVLERFSWSHIAGDVIELYRELTAGGTG